MEIFTILKKKNDLANCFADAFGGLKSVIGSYILNKNE